MEVYHVADKKPHIRESNRERVKCKVLVKVRCINKDNRDKERGMGWGKS